jgi:hypothetical protein
VTSELLANEIGVAALVRWFPSMIAVVLDRQLFALLDVCNGTAGTRTIDDIHVAVGQAGVIQSRCFLKHKVIWTPHKYIHRCNTTDLYKEIDFTA